MKKCGKILSLILTAAMLPTMFTAHAESVKYQGDTNLKLQDWSINYATNRTAWNTEQDYAAVTTDEARTGNAALCINIESPKESSRYINVQNDMVSALEANQTYRVAFWYKGAGTNFDICFNWSYRNSIVNFNIDEVDGEWKHYYMDIPITTVPTAKNMMIFFENKQNAVIDDISVAKVIQDGENISFGDELIKNGSFETYTVGAEVFGVKNEFYKTTSWNLSYNLNDMDFSQDYAKPTKKYAHSGEYGMYVQFATAKTSNKYYRIVNKVTPAALEAGTYKIELYARGNFAPNSMKVGTLFGTVGGVATDTTIGNMQASAADENGWKQYTYQFTIASKDVARDFGLLFENTCSGVIDDVRLYNVNNPEVNLIVDGGFEQNKVQPLAESKYTADGWAKAQNGVPAAMWEKEFYFEPTQKEAYSGSYSLHAVFPTWRGFSNKYMHYRVVKSFPAGKYHLSFYVKGDYLQFGVGLGWTETGCWYKATPESVFTKTDAGNGWTRFDADMTTTSTMGYFQILVDRNAFDLYIDNISVTAEGSSTNLITNGDFESVKTAGETIRLINPIAYPTKAGKSINVSWKNPFNTGIEFIKVYLDGVENKNTVVDTGSSAFNEFLIDGLNNDQQYEIKLVTKIAGQEYVDTLYATPDNKGSIVNIGDWNVTRNELVLNNLTYCDNFVASIDSNEKASGNSSLRIDANMPTQRSNQFPNVYQTLKMHTDTLYRLVLKAKTKNVTRFYLIEDANITRNGVSQHIWYNVPIERSGVAVTKDWTEYAIDLNPTTDIDGKPCEVYNIMEDDVVYNTNIRLVIDQIVGSVWLDDVGVYAVDPYTGEITGENLLKNGGFEFKNYEISEPTYSLIVDDEKFDIDFLESGLIEVTTKIKNYSMGNNFNAMVAVALYNGNSLYSVTMMEKKISQQPYQIPAEEFTASVNVPDLSTGDFYLKVLYWDGVNEMKSIKDYSDFKPANAE